MRLSLIGFLSALACKDSSATILPASSHYNHTGIRIRSPVSFSAPTLGVAQNHVSIRRSAQSQPRHEALRRFLGHDGEHVHSRSEHSHRSVASINLRGTSYITDVSLGTQIIPLLIDTGSADLWAATSSFICLDANGNEIAQSGCGFPVLFEGNLSGGVVPGQYFSVYYGSGQFAYGPYGLETVSLGGITVPGQQIALPSTGYIQSSTGDYSGILGLGYPGIVAARNGTVPQLALNTTDPFASYDSWFFSATKKNLTKPVFSLALKIDGGGLLGIGGAVDVPITGNYASTPILMVRRYPSLNIPNIAVQLNIIQVDLVGETRAETQFTFYTIFADDYLINGQSVSSLSSSTNATSGGVFPVIVDSGYSANILPPSIVDMFYSAFSTPPLLVDIGGSSMLATACDADVPSFGVQINSQIFNMTAQDIIVSSMNTTVNGTLLCGLGIQPGVEEAGALGDPFLSSVVAVFDIGASEMRFAQRAAETSEGGAGSGDMPKAIPSQNPTDQDGPSCLAVRPRQNGV